jgi:hypothetical protein
MYIWSSAQPSKCQSKDINDRQTASPLPGALVLWCSLYYIEGQPPTHPLRGWGTDVSLGPLGPPHLQ